MEEVKQATEAAESLTARLKALEDAKNVDEEEQSDASTSGADKSAPVATKPALPPKRPSISTGGKPLLPAKRPSISTGGKPLPPAKRPSISGPKPAPPLKRPSVSGANPTPTMVSPAKKTNVKPADSKDSIGAGSLPSTAVSGRQPSLSKGKRGPSAPKPSSMEKQQPPKSAVSPAEGREHEYRRPKSHNHEVSTEATAKRLEEMTFGGLLF